MRKVREALQLLRPQLQDWGSNGSSGGRNRGLPYQNVGEMAELGIPAVRASSSGEAGISVKTAVGGIAGGTGCSVIGNCCV